MFLTGYIAGVHFVQTLTRIIAGESVPPVVSVGRTEETEVVEHDDIEEALDYIVINLYPYAVVVIVEAGTMRWLVCRPDVPDDMVARIEMKYAIGPIVTTSEPIVDAGEDFDRERYFEGFAAGIDAEERAFEITDHTASTLLAQRSSDEDADQRRHSRHGE